MRLEEWIAREAVRFDLADPESVASATDRVIGSLGPDVELLGLAEALHGSEEILLMRNRMFERLAERHGFSAIVIETSSPQARVIDDYVAGVRERPDPEVEAWFGSGFGLLEANRELVEWLRRHNTGAPEKLHFYGFDLPLGAGCLASPSRVLDIALDYLERADPARAEVHRERITSLVGDPREWERPEAMFDPAQSIGLGANATALRIAVLDLISDLRIHGPEYVLKSHPLAFEDALHHADLAQKLLDAHAALATPGAYARMLGIRDLIMADNLRHFVRNERGRGKVFVFSASGHLKRGTIEWRLPPGDDVKEWWSAGSHLTQAMGARYAVIGMALGESEANGVGAPEPGTIEAALAEEGASLFIPTRRGLAAAPVRTGSTLNPTYSWLTPASYLDFEWLVFLPTTKYHRGGLPLTEWG